MNEKFKKWVIDLIKDGYSKSEIKKYLKSHGYSSDYIKLVDEVFKEDERNKNKEHRNMAIAFISLVIALFLISYAFSSESKIPNMSIEKCIKEYTNSGDTIISWWDWGNLIEKNGRKAVIKAPSIDYIKYTINPESFEGSLSNRNITREIAHLLTTNNTLIIKKIMRNLNSSFILIVPPYNEKLAHFYEKHRERE